VPGTGLAHGRREALVSYEFISGSQAAALAVQRVGVDLVAAYPITPQTAIVETLASFDALGSLGADFVSVESEYSALACCNGAAAAGARVFTATASHGLAYMHEMIHWCSGARLPIVMVNVNRCIGAPWCLDPDQGDSLSQRDTGWMQLYCSGAQEVFDTVLQAYRLSEELLLPCMVVFDGFYISHTYEAVDVPDPEKVREFIGPPAFEAQVRALTQLNIHGIVSGEQYHELVRRRHLAMMQAFGEFETINEHFNDLFGRCYGVIDAYIPAGADTVVLAAGAVAETVNWLLPVIEPVGLIKLKMFRPFPAVEICSLLEDNNIGKVIVIDRNCSVGAGGIFARELKAGLYNMKKKPEIYDLILAGGIDLDEKLLAVMLEKVATGKADHLEWGRWIY